LSYDGAVGSKSTVTTTMCILLYDIVILLDMNRNAPLAEKNMSVETG